MFKLRNRDTGRRGHPTRFAELSRTDAVSPLTPPARVVVDVTDIHRYFAGHTTGRRAPWYYERRQPLERDGDWANVAPQDLDITGLWSLRDRLHPKAAAKVARGEQRGDPYPRLVSYGDRTFVYDGHHRIADAIANGDTTLNVRLIHLYQGDYIDDIVI